jgi:hypothetical protein
MPYLAGVLAEPATRRQKFELKAGSTCRAKSCHCGNDALNTSAGMRASL